MRSLRARLLATLLVVGVVQLLVVVVALVSLQLVRADQDRVTRDFYSTVRDSSTGYSTVLQLEMAALTYERTGLPEDLQAVQALLAPRPGAVGIDELRRRLRGQDQALRALDRIAGSAQAWGKTVQAQVAAVQAGGPSAVPPADRAQLQQQFATVQQDYTDYIDGITKARDQAVARLDHRTTLLLVAVLLAVATSVVAGVALYLALRTWVTRPIAALASEARTVRSGALDHEVAVSGPPEIVGLGNDVEAMRRAVVLQLSELQVAQTRLERQAEELRRSNRDLEQFAYVASHDLQEPLRKVSSFCQMLERRYKGQLDERADQYIEFAVDGAKRMQLLINDLLAFSRVGRVTDGTAEVRMADVVADALRNLSTTLEETGAVVEVDEMPVVHGERRLLVQLVQNLVGNAVKFRGEEPPVVRVQARRDGDEWQFAVSDNGIGIEPRYAERIFVIFQRLHAKSEYEGTGIGLALCKKIVEHHGGTIWLDTSAPRGAVFRWTLPVGAPADDEPATDSDDGAAQPAAGREAAWSAS